MKKYITLDTHKIEVSVSNGCRMVNGADISRLLDENIYDAFIDAGYLTDALFKKIYKYKNATPQQEIIFKGLCIVGIYSLIDEVCDVDLRGVSYVNEFNNMVNKDIK